MKFHLPPRDIIQDENVTYLFALCGRSVRRGMVNTTQFYEAYSYQRCRGCQRKDGNR